MTKSKNNDLWADIAEDVIELSPRQLMKEQAAYLKEKTKGLLVAEVLTSQTGKTLSTTEGGTAGREKFIQTFSLVVPTLKYRYDLFSVSHHVLGYPAKFDYNYSKEDLVAKEDMIANNEKEFLSILKSILSSDKTSRILASLLAQARA